VQQSPQLALVDPVGDGPGEVRRRDATGAAQSVTGEASFRIRYRIDGFPAARAKRPGLGGKIVPAGAANRKEGETSKWKAADAAVGGEKNGGEAVEGADPGTSEHANHRAPSRYVRFRWRNFGSARPPVNRVLVHWAARQGKTLTEDTPRFGGTEGTALCWLQYTGEACGRQHSRKLAVPRRYSGKGLQIS
jgi:hypothetical protein